MNKQDIISFFDECAPLWDKETVRNEQVIAEILDKGGVYCGADVLDVACGTGVLFPDYINRKAASVTGIDISPEMVKIAKNKFIEIEVICADAETYNFEKQFDAVMIYNAFPHFGSPHKLIANLSKSLKKGGRLSIAHGMSREELQKCHSGSASRISLPLPEKEKLAELMSLFLDVDVMISDSRMYMISGVKM